MTVATAFLFVFVEHRLLVLLFLVIIQRFQEKVISQKSKNEVVSKIYAKTLLLSTSRVGFVPQLSCSNAVVPHPDSFEICAPELWPQMKSLVTVTNTHD